MNAIRFIAAAALSVAAAAPVLAQEATPDTWMNVASTHSRADVQAALVAARADGSIKAWSSGYIEPLKSTETRAEVRAEAREALRSGEITQINARVPSTVVAGTPVSNGLMASAR